MEIFQRLTKWAIFNVLIALLPIFLNLLSSLSRGNSVTIIGLFSHGELLLLTAAISAAAIGELIASGKNLINLKLISAGSNVMLLYLSASWYVEIINVKVINPAVQPDYNFIAIGSLVIFISSLISSASCIALSELK